MKEEIGKPPKAGVLLVDDNRHGSLARKSLLEEAGYSATSVSCAEDALDLLATKHFDLIVTDLRMPKMNGIEFIRHVRKDWPAMPIIMLSGFIEPLGLDEKSTGADAVIPKGANEISHLKRSMTRLLDRRSPKKQSASQRRLRATAKGA